MINSRNFYDVAVIGGGPAGMMAAGRAAELGAKVILLERNEALGKKLLLTGNGRCNITHAEFNDKKFIEKLGKNNHWFFSSLATFGPNATTDFFAKNGLQTKTEKDGRVFPVSDRAQDVLNLLLNYLKKGNVKILYKERILDLNAKNEHIESLSLIDKREIYAKSFILCTGGAGYPATGSDGDGYEFARKFGHKIASPRPALSPIETTESWVKKLQGIDLKNVDIKILQNNKKQESKIGDMIFTHYGLSGPAILDLSKKISELLPLGQVVIKIDLRPELDFIQMDKLLQKDFAAMGAINFKNYLSQFLPQRLAEILAKLSGINNESKLGLITRKERKAATTILKSLKLTARGPMRFERANITCGGVDLSEIDSKSMRSKIIKNLFFAGEIINLDGPTGGYNLQICWTTGFAAGSNAML